MGRELLVPNNGSPFPYGKSIEEMYIQINSPHTKSWWGMVN